MIRRATLMLSLLFLAVACAGDGDRSTPENKTAGAAQRLEPRFAVNPAPGQFGEPCGPVQTPPSPYFNYEALWIVAGFDQPDLPFEAIYSYFWIDRYLLEGCAYTTTFSVIYPKAGDLSEAEGAGGYYSGYPTEYLSTETYDVKVFPFLHGRRDPDDWQTFHIDLIGPDYTASFKLELDKVIWWSPYYFSNYNARLTEGTVEYRGQTYAVTGRAGLERWYQQGGYDPFDPDSDKLLGYWHYEPYFWRDEAGNEIQTLVWTWKKTEGGQTTLSVRGRLCRNGVEHALVAGESNYDFPENYSSGGYLRTQDFSGMLDDGTTFTYRLEAVKEYRDSIPARWHLELPDTERRAHVYAEGVLEYEGEEYTGGGVWEWRTTIENPLLAPDKMW